MTLHIAAREGNIFRVREFVISYARAGPAGIRKINQPDSHDSTPLYYACLCGHAHIVRYLLKTGAELNLNYVEGQRCYLGALTEEIRALIRQHHQQTYGEIRSSEYQAQTQSKNTKRVIRNLDDPDRLITSSIGKTNIIALFALRYEDIVRKWCTEQEQHINAFFGPYTLFEHSTFLNHPYITPIIREFGGNPTERTYFHRILEDANRASLDYWDDGSQHCDITLEIAWNRVIKTHSIILYCRCARLIEALFTLSRTDVNQSNLYSRLWLQTSFYHEQKAEKKIDSCVEIPISLISQQSLFSLISFYYSENLYITEDIQKELANFETLFPTGTFQAFPQMSQHSLPTKPKPTSNNNNNNTTEAHLPEILSSVEDAYQQYLVEVEDKELEAERVHKNVKYESFLGEIKKTTAESASVEFFLKNKEVEAVETEQPEEQPQEVAKPELPKYRRDLFDASYIQKSVPNKQFNSSLLTDFRMAVNNPVGCDVIFVFPPSVTESPRKKIVDQPYCIFAHRVLLSRCDYFRALVLGGMREAQSTLIPVDELSVLAHLHLLEFVYTGRSFHFSHPPAQWQTDFQFQPKPKPMSLTQLGLNAVLENLHLYDNVDLFTKQFIVNMMASDPKELEKQTQYWLTGNVAIETMVEIAFELVPAAEEFMLPQLANACKNFLSQYVHPSLENALDILGPSKILGLTQLTRKCYHAIAKKFEVFMMTHEQVWQQLSQEDRNEISICANTRTDEEKTEDSKMCSKLIREQERMENDRRRKEEAKAKQDLAAKKKTEAPKTEDFGEVLVFVDKNKNNNNAKKGGKKKKK